MPVVKSRRGITQASRSRACAVYPYTGNSAQECTVEPDGHSTITINGNVTVEGAVAVLLNGITVHGNVTLCG
ncbi:hypothetical protein GCM10027057_20660 [Marisediminicola antarctica]